MSVYPIFTPNQQNKCSKPSMNHQEQNRMKHRKQLKTHLGSLGCNGLAPSYLFFLPSEDHSQRKIKIHFFPVTLSSFFPLKSSDACCQSFPLCFSSRQSQNLPKEYSFLPLLSPMRVPLSHSFPFLTYIYHPSRLKFVSKKRKILLFPFFFSSFFKSSNQKQSSQIQIPLQNLPRRVPPSLNSNGKFPCKNMKFLKLNN